MAIVRDMRGGLSSTADKEVGKLNKIVPSGRLRIPYHQFSAKQATNLSVTKRANESRQNRFVAILRWRITSNSKAR